MDLKDLIIKESYTVLEAMTKINEAATKIVFIEDEGKLKASLTDGDIRRWIVAGGKLDENVSKVANYNPIFIKRQNVHRRDELFTKKKSIYAVPVIDNEMNIVAIVLENGKIIQPDIKLEYPIVMMAGGKGTRLYPYTKILPKPLIPVGGIPIAEIILDRMSVFGFDKFFMIVNHKKNMIKSYFSEIEKGYNLEFVDEEIPLGTGGGLSLLKGKVDKTFILTNCDTLLELDYEEIIKHHILGGNAITMVCASKTIKIPYGIIERDDFGTYKSIKEKPEISFLVNTGFYIIEPKVIDILECEKSYGMPTIIDICCNRGDRVGVYEIDGEDWLDMGQPDELDRMRRKLGLED